MSAPGNDENCLDVVKENMGSILSQNESIFWQSLANVAFLVALNDFRFIECSYFDKLDFGNQSFKWVLKKSGLGNPAMMQMMLYALLVMPKAVLTQKEFSGIANEWHKIDEKFEQFVECKETTYGSDSKGVRYMRHIRNAVSHARCTFTEENERYFVVFEDEDEKKGERCTIKVECVKIGFIMNDLQKLMLKYLESKQK